MVRTDAAGCSPTPVGELAKRNIGYVTSARTSPVVAAAIRCALGDPDCWHTAGSSSQRRRNPVRAQVADLAGWPQGTHLVVRREPRHPGAQRSLFESELCCV